MPEINGPKKRALSDVIAAYERAIQVETLAQKVFDTARAARLKVERSLAPVLEADGAAYDAGYCYISHCGVRIERKPMRIAEDVEVEIETDSPPDPGPVGGSVVAPGETTLENLAGIKRLRMEGRPPVVPGDAWEGVPL